MSVIMDNLDLVVFSEKIREKMQSTSPSLVRQRRPMFRAYPDVFIGNEAVSWASNNQSLANLDDKNNNDTKDDATSALNECEVLNLFQRLMGAGLIRNVQTMEGFQNDKSLYRFSSDEVEGDEFVRSVAIGYRLYKSAKSPDSNLFQKVCEFGLLVSNECIRSCDIVTWLVDSGLCQTREIAEKQGSLMHDHKIIKPVDNEVKSFSDGRSFFMFAVDFTRRPITIKQFLRKSRSDGHHKINYLRQTNRQPGDVTSFSSNGLPRQSSRHKALSSSSDDSGYDNGSVSPPTYKTLLNNDGSMTSEALLHPTAPYVRKVLKVYPDPLGYGFVIRGSGPSYVKIVDPDSPAGKAGLQAKQYIININGTDVTQSPHLQIEDLILNGSKLLKITVMEHTSNSEKRKGSTTIQTPPITPVTPTKNRSFPSLPTAQPWIKRR